MKAPAARAPAAVETRDSILSIVCVVLVCCCGSVGFVDV